jgi:hypothetical protein
VKEDLRQMQEFNNKYKDILQNKTNEIQIMRDQVNQLQSTITEREDELSSFQKKKLFWQQEKKSNNMITFVHAKH